MLPWQPNTTVHDYNTRIKNNIRNVKVEHEFAKKCIRYNIPITINSTSDVILDKIKTHSISGFTQYIKNHLVNQYSVNCQIADCYVCNHSR